MVEAKTPQFTGNCGREDRSGSCGAAELLDDVSRYAVLSSPKGAFHRNNRVFDEISDSKGDFDEFRREPQVVAHLRSPFVLWVWKSC